MFLKRIRRKIYNISKKTGDRLGFDLPYFVENGFWVVLSQIVNMAASFAMSVVFARYLPKETFGEYQLVISFVGIFAIISYSGLNTSIVRSVARGFDYSYIKAVKFSFKKSLFAIPLFLGLACWYYYQNKFQLSLAFVASGLLFSFIYAHRKWMAYWKGKEKFEKAVKQQIIQNLTLNGLLILSAIFFSEYLLIIAGTYLLINAGFNTFWHYKTKKSITIKKVDEDCIPYGKYMTKIGLLANLILYFDKIIIGFYDIEILAVYAIALKLFDILKQVLKSFFSVSAPKFAKQNVSIGKNKILMLLFSGIVVSVFLYFISEPIIVYFFTEDYRDSALLFKKLIFVLPLVFVSPLFAQKANVQKDKNKIVKIYIVVPSLAIVSSVLVLIITQNLEYFVLTKVFMMQIAYFLFLVPIFRKR